MFNILIENHLLLEVQAIPLKDIKTYLLNLTNTDAFKSLADGWNKKYKKYGNFLKRILTDAGAKEITENDLKKVLNVLNRYEVFVNTSELKPVIFQDWKKITVSLQDLINHIEEQENKIIFSESDKVSLQTILSSCGPLDKLIGKTYSCKDYDIVYCSKDHVVIKPKTVKGSVAWALSDNNANLERFGPNHIDPVHRISWCTSVYSANEETWNEFLGYYLGSLVTLFYVINRSDYIYGENNRKICIGVDDTNNEILFDRSESVDANNSQIENEDDLRSLIGSDSQVVIESIKSNRSNIAEKLKPVDFSIKDLKTLFANKNKSTSARAMFRTFLLTNGRIDGDIDKIIFCLEMLLNENNRSENDNNFISDLIDGIFTTGFMGDGLFIDKKTLKLFEDITKSKNIDAIMQIIDNIHYIVVENGWVDVFDNSLLEVLKMIIDNTSINTLLRSVEEIINKIDLDGTNIDLNDLHPIKELLKDKVFKIDNLEVKAKRGNARDIDELIRNEVYKLNNILLNSNILKNPSIFDSENGNLLLDYLFINTNSIEHKSIFKYFQNIYDVIMRNPGLSEYSKIKDLLYKNMTDVHLMSEFFQNESNNLFSLFDYNESEFKNYLSGIYIIYDKMDTADSSNICAIIESDYNEDSYSLAVGEINATKFSNDAKRKLM